MLVKTINNSFPKITDNFFTRDFFDFPVTRTNNRTTSPAVNIYEDDNTYSLEVSIPGLDKKDVKVEIEHDVLTISHDVKNSEESKDNLYTRREFTYQSFSRSFKLPENEVKKDKVKATYTKGVLYITLPKKEEAKPEPKRLISIG